MSLGMYIVGFVIFSIYIYFTIWNINNGSKSQAEEISKEPDEIDMDGMGNYSRFPKDEME